MPETLGQRAPSCQPPIGVTRTASRPASHEARGGAAEALDLDRGLVASLHPLRGDETSEEDELPGPQRAPARGQAVGEPRERREGMPQDVAPVTASGDRAVDGDRSADALEVEPPPLPDGLAEHAARAEEVVGDQRTRGDYVARASSSPSSASFAGVG